MSDEQLHGIPTDARADAAYFASPEFDPDRFMAGLRYLPDNPAGEAGDLPVPPRLTEEDVVLVSRQLPVDVDAELRAAAAAEHITVDELLRRWTRQHHAA